MVKLGAVILAAGKSTRMKSRVSKVMHPLAGKPLVSYPVKIAKVLGADPILVVTGTGQNDLKTLVDSLGVSTVHQKEALGTAHAVLSSKRALSKFSGYVVILSGDVPLIKAETLKPLVDAVAGRGVACGFLTMELADPKAYGRVVRDLEGEVVRIVETVDASSDELAIHEVNTGIYCVESKWLFETLKRVEPKNKKREYYLTDIIHYAINEGKKVLAMKADDPQEFLGINSRADLALVSSIMRDRINLKHMLAGVGIIDPKQTYIDESVRIGSDTTIFPNSFLSGDTEIGEGCVIENGAVLRDVKIGKCVRIKSYSVLEGSEVASGASIGPFSRIRPASKIGKNVRVGNFVELKKSNLQSGAKANHLAYLGDTSVGPNVNIGCGTITCNYDGVAKHRTIIEEGAFIGSDTQFIAPVRIGKGAIVGAGSTITKNVPPKALALSRAPQVIVKSWKPKNNKARKSASKTRNR